MCGRPRVVVSPGAPADANAPSREAQGVLSEPLSAAALSYGAGQMWNVIEFAPSQSPIAYEPDRIWSSVNVKAPTFVI